MAHGVWPSALNAAYPANSARRIEDVQDSNPIYDGK